MSTTRFHTPQAIYGAARETMRLRRRSLKTEETYLSVIRRYVAFHGRRSPESMGVEEIRAFLSHLAIEQNVAASTQNVAFNALLFLYREVLEIQLDGIGNIERARRPRRLPAVLTRDEVRRTLDQLTGVHRLMAGLLYGSGLRLNECLRLRVKDVDIERAEITVREAKGDKDRRTMLSGSLVDPLRRHLG